MVKVGDRILIEKQIEVTVSLIHKISDNRYIIFYQNPDGLTNSYIIEGENKFKVIKEK